MTYELPLVFRPATIEDLPFVVRMLADDFLAVAREDRTMPVADGYIQALKQIDEDPNNELIVVELEGDIVGSFQLSYIPSISTQGGSRCIIESVRVDSDRRGSGIGNKMMMWVIDRAKSKGCVSLDLTTHNDRTAAYRFYERLGFQASHTGMKLKLVHE